MSTEPVTEPKPTLKQKLRRLGNKTMESVLVVLMSILALAILGVLPFACGACGGLVERGYKSVQPGTVTLMRHHR